MSTSNAKKMGARTSTAHSPTTKSNSSIILVDIRASSVSITTGPKGTPKTRWISSHSSHRASTDNSAHLRIMTVNFRLNSLTNSPGPYSLTYTCTKLSGAPLRLTTTDRNACMLTTFKIFAEIQRNITMSRRSVQTGRKMKISKVFRMRDALRVWTARSVMGGSRSSSIRLSTQNRKAQTRKTRKNKKHLRIRKKLIRHRPENY